MNSDSRSSYSISKVVWALLSPGAPRGTSRVSIEHRDDGPGAPYPSFVLAELHASESAAYRAATNATQNRGYLRRLVVELRLINAEVVDARPSLDVRALKRCDRSALELVAELYQGRADILRVAGPEGEIALVFGDSFGHGATVLDEQTVDTPSRRSRRTEFVYALVAAGIVDLLVKLPLSLFILAALLANTAALFFMAHVVASIARGSPAQTIRAPGERPREPELSWIYERTG